MSRKRGPGPSPGERREFRSRPVRRDLVRSLILEAYASIRTQGRIADRTLDFLLRRERRLWASERRAVAEGVYGLLRDEVRLDYLLRRSLGPRYEALGELARHALLYEAWRVSEGESDPHAALRESGLSLSLLPGLEALRSPEAIEALLPRDPAERLGVLHGLPPWIASLFLREVGEEAEALAAAMSRRAPLTLRANALRTTREGLLSRLRDEGIEGKPTRFSPWGVVTDGKVNVFQLRSFRDGLFEVQDEGSQLLSLLLAPRPGWKVVDACAGSGGKTLALAAMMENRGRIVALDSDERRLAQLGPRARRAGIHNWESHVVPATGRSAVEERLGGWADAVLVDAPCTGLGVLRRNPDARFRLRPEDVAGFAALQRDILSRYALLVREGGFLVYGTCSLAREEDEEVVERFLSEHPDFEALSPSATLGEEVAEPLGAREHLRLFPHRQGTDGFFGALLRRRPR